MNLLSRSLLVSLLLPGGLAQAADRAWLGKADCRIAPVLPAPGGGVIAWSGACKDGYAEGSGVLEWRPQGGGKRRLEGVLARGEVQGNAIMVYPGGKYEGSVANGQPEGSGVEIAYDGSTYEGQWQAGKRHGSGKARFALGGSYEGEWRRGRMHGQGTIVYSGGRTHTGEFVDGRAADAAPLPVAAGERERFALKEEHPVVGSLLARTRAIGFAPMDASWQDLTPEQQTIMRRAYPALDERDEPPYPLKGTRAYYKGIADLYRKFLDYQGDATVYVTVGADGVPTSASTYGVAHREFARYVAMIGMLQRFKPALCGGTPCEMIFPLRFHFQLQR